MRKHRSIKFLASDAIRKNSIKSQYQLSKNYKEGRFVEQDLDLSNNYLNMVDQNFGTTTLRLKSIRLINFRGFKDISIDLSTKYIVIAANNGYGKTGVLESIYNCLTWLIRNFNANGANGHFLKEEDIRASEGVDSASVILDVCLMQGDLENSTFSINLSKTNNDAKSKQDSFYQEFKSLAEMYRELVPRGYSIPVLAFYSIERGSAIKKNEFRKNTDELLKEFNSNEYHLNIANTPRFEIFLAWMLTEITGNALNKDEKDISYFLNTTLKTLESLKKLDSKDPSIKEAIISLKNDAFNYLEKSRSQKIKSSTEKMDMIFSAIYIFMPEISDLKPEYNHLKKSVDLTCHKNGCKISVSQLSQGEKTMLSLVCDISLRLISANSNSKNPFSGNGIIIIDEIDLHLHPIWQQTILLRLRDTFPNIQFIISTHSSNVLSTSDSECIRKISGTEDKESGIYDIEVPLFSLGAETSVVQEEIQGVSSRPDELTIIKKLNYYKRLVSEDMWDTEEAENLFAELCKWGEGHDTIINKLRLDVTLRKRRREK
ncbi:AAA family ATPase [Morganella morganii]|uniref:AAA family ATPase n=1 Tax=Morganella morganii TaxID=582 RepID=UPI0013C2D8B9|nr:AAA family ATPase [Morganella morganii]